jgi:hypothetical protein
VTLQVPGLITIIPHISKVITPRAQAKIDRFKALYKDAKQRARRRQSFRLQALLDETPAGKVVFHRMEDGLYRADFTGTLVEFQALSRVHIRPLFDRGWSIRTLRPLIADGALWVEVMDEECRPLTVRFVDNVWVEED